MKVFDPRNLVDERLLEIVTKHHPLYRDMASELSLVCVEEETDQNIHVRMDEGNNVQLAIHPMIRPTERDLYILYHEFGHIGDRLNPDFHYDHDTRLSLSFSTEKCLLVLWNVFIDTRLNQHGLFRLPAGGLVEITVDGFRYRLPRNDISTYLLEAVAGLSSQGVHKPGAKVTAIWSHPGRFLSFSDLLDLA
ncbi:MAG: hypothetical protein K9K64_03095 [Desulfohalobiaceae bacterium]|nr:hypothetical protein [Desulfohalobiaceae bacterium]